MKKLICKIFSLAFFVVPPLYFVFSRSAKASAFSLVGVSGCVILIIAWLIFSRFFLNRITDRVNGMITIWRADIKVEDNVVKRDKMRLLIGRYENILLALKIPLPALVIIGLLTFLGAVEQAAANLSAMLGICSLFWIIGVVLLFISNLKNKQ